MIVSGHDHRRVRPHAVRPDDRGVLELGRATRGRWRSGLNCALGAALMRPYIEELARVADTFVSCYPNAGLPNPMAETGYDETPAQTSRLIRDFARAASSTSSAAAAARRPRTSARSPRRCSGIAPRQACRGGEAGREPLDASPACMRLSGLEPLNIGDDSLFVNVGERTNVTGSRAFAKLILAGDFAGARRGRAPAGAERRADHRRQHGRGDARLEGGDGALPEPDRLRARHRPRAGDDRLVEVGGDRGGPEVRAGQADRQLDLAEGGRGRVPAQAKLVRRYGAAVIVMAFDEKGQADTFERKTSICQRCYDLLTSTRSGFPPEDIVFDPNVFAIATGIEEHNNYAVDFINATRWIKAAPAAREGVRRHLQRVSFSLPRQRAGARGDPHGVPLPRDPRRPDDGHRQRRPARRLRRARRRSCASASRTSCSTAGPTPPSALVTFAETFKAQGKARDEDLAWREGTVEARLSHALVKGITTYIVEDTEEARQKYARADPGDRGPADGRHERRRRPLRRRQDVPAAGGEVARA